MAAWIVLALVSALVVWFSVGFFTCEVFGLPSTLSVDPTSIYLGCLSTADPIESEIQPGRTTIRLLSHQDWRLEISMPTPLHRMGDGLELQRTGVSDPMLESLLSRNPCVVTSGKGSPEWQLRDVDWNLFTRAAEQILNSATLPGTYEAILQARLVDDSGNALSEWVSGTIRLDVAGWVHLLNDVQVIEMSTGAFGGEGEVVKSEPASMFVAGNTDWRLSAAQVGPLTSLDGTREISNARLAIGIVGGNAQESAIDGYVALGQEPVTVARGHPASAVPGLSEEIPIVLRLESDSPLPAGRYMVSLVFEASPQEPIP